MLNDWYKRFIWGWTTHRPWTYIMREWYTQNKLLFAVMVFTYLALLTFVGVLIGGIVGGLLAICGFASGALWGHLRWDTKGDFIKHEDDFKDGNTGW